MAEEKKKTSSNAWVPLLFIGAFALYAVVNGGEDDTTAEAKYDADGCLPAYDGFLASKYFVRHSMKAPDTAEVSNSMESAYHKTGVCTYRASGYVDAQNSFGATLQRQWVAEVEYLPSENGWKLIDLALNE